MNDRNFDAVYDEDNPDGFLEAGDLGTEGLLFMSAADSPNRRPLLGISNEVSGTVTIFEVLTTR